MTVRRIAAFTGIVAGVAALLFGSAVYLQHLAAQAKCSQGVASGCPSPSPTTLIMTGQAMLPTLADATTLPVDTGAYLRNGPKRGDIVAFSAPGQSEQRLVRRIIGLPGDRILITNGKIYINGLRLSEPYEKLPWTFNTDWPANPSTGAAVSAGTYFLLGDNRDHSLDSRTFGFISLRSIIGRVSAAGQNAPTLTKSGT